MSCPMLQSAVALNKAMLPLDWLVGTWESDTPGQAAFPNISPFHYNETLHFTHDGEPCLNFIFHAKSEKLPHKESGFILIQPDTNRVAFIIAQNSGLVEIEEGELDGKKLSLESRGLARTSFAKKPFVQQLSRVFQLKDDGKLELTVSMALENQPLTKFLHITYHRRALKN